MHSVVGKSADFATPSFYVLGLEQDAFERGLAGSAAATFPVPIIAAAWPLFCTAEASIEPTRSLAEITKCFTHYNFLVVRTTRIKTAKPSTVGIPVRLVERDSHLRMFLAIFPNSAAIINY